MNSFVDFVVQQIYSDARFDQSRATPAPVLARSLIGPAFIHRVSNQRDQGWCASSKSVDGQLVVHVSTGTAPWRLNHRIARLLARWYLARHGYDGANVEGTVSALAAAVCMPSPAVLRFREGGGDDLRRLSAHFCVSQSLAALRLAECVGYPTALRTARKIIVRGNHWAWPLEAREWARLFRRARSTEFCIQRLSDVRGRVVLRARNHETLEAGEGEQLPGASR